LIAAEVVSTMHVLITGAGSFIGRHATVALARGGLRVTASFRTESPATDLLKSSITNVDFVRLDLANANHFLALPKSVDRIVHVAGVSMMPGSGVDEMLACNVVGARTLIKYASTAKASHVVVASTLSVYGDVVDGAVTETTPVRSPDMYGASKYLAERLFAAESHWLPCAAVRLPGVLGKGAHRAWIPTLFDRVRNNEKITIYNPQSMFNNAAHVDDLNDLFVKLLQRPWSGFHAFPIGAAGQISIKDLAELLIRITGSRSSVSEGSAQKKPFIVSSDYAAKNFGYRSMDIETMLRKYVGESL
jgi:nucleoside-diphosphate-sugar epimerase